jgi:ankyrin repeat protein
MTADEWANWIAEHDTTTELEAALERDPSLATQRTSLGNTLLHEAAWHKRASLVAALLAARADPNARGDLGRTPLHCAVHDCAAAEAAPIVRLLLAHYALPELEDSAGHTVAEAAAFEIWDDQAAILALLGAPTPVESAPISGDDAAATIAALQAIQTEGATARAITLLLRAFRDGTTATVPPDADPTCVGELQQLLDAVARTTWAPAVRAWLRGFKPGHAKRLLRLYRSPNGSAASR